MPRPNRNEIYTAFINHEQCILTEPDRLHLRTTRGFPDEIIDAARFRSARPENTNIINDLQAQFSRDELIDAGLLVVRAGQVVPCSQLLELRVIIPYLCEDAEGVYLIRPHKMGLRNVPISFYCAGQNADNIVLTESEFKAVAAYCFGHPAIGIPGISSFCKEHFNRLINYILEEHIERVTVVFDNEIKNDPNLPNFKPDPEKRWDTQYYAALMARRISESANIEALVGTLPDTWRINGKIDIDGALAAGHTPEDFDTVISTALRSDDYLSGLPDEGRAIAVRKTKAFYLGMKIRRTSHGYEIAAKKQGGDTEWQPISNFTIDIVSMIDSSGKIERDVRIDLDGKTGPIIRIAPDDMVNTDRFQTALYGVDTGRGMFWGSKDDLQDIFELEHLRTREAIVYQPDHVGKIDGKDLWLFGNGAIINGEVVYPDESGVVWNGNAGFLPPKCVEASLPKDEQVSGSINWNQRLPMPNFKDLNANLKTIAQSVFRNYGGENGGHHAMMAVAWALACPYSNEIHEEFGCFPILYLIGEKESGKTTMARWLLRMHGLTFPGFNADGSSAVAISRVMSFYASIPMFFDECREHVLRNANKESLLRSAYDRQSIGKGTREGGYTIRSLPVRTPIIICGEHVPSDPALITRCLFPEFSSERPGYGCEYREIDRCSRQVFPKILPQILLRGPTAQTIMDSINEWNLAFQEQKMDIRRAQNCAVISAAYLNLIDPDDEIGFMPWLSKVEINLNAERKDDDHPHEFFEDLAKMRDDDLIKDQIDYMISGDEFYIAFRRVWNIWKQNYQRGQDVMGPRSALVLLKSKGWVLKTNHLRRVGRNVVKTVCIKLRQDVGCPQCIIDFCTG